MTLCLYTDAATFTSFVDIHRRLHIVLANWDQTADCSIFTRQRLCQGNKSGMQRELF